MLWIDPWTIACVAALGGMVGAVVMACANRQNTKFNVRLMEDFWNSDIKRLEALIDDLKKKVSTISVDKHVIKTPGHRQGKSYNHTRRF